VTQAILKRVQAGLSSADKYEIRYWDVDSARDGPCVLILAALHANELQGSEILYRALPRIESGLLRGRCLIVPFANPMALERYHPHIDFEYDRYYGDDAKNNVNCSWPGDPEGSSAERLSHALREAVVEQATHLLDLHCWNRVWAATALAPLGHEPSLRLAEATALRFGVRRPRRTEPPYTAVSYFLETGRTGIAIEFAGQYGFWPKELERGIVAVRNYLRCLEMLPGKLEGKHEPTLWMDESHETEVTAPLAGVFLPEELSTSDYVGEGALLGHILNHETLARTRVCAPSSGYLYKYGALHRDLIEHVRAFHHPFVNQGEPIASIVRGKTG